MNPYRKLMVTDERPANLELWMKDGFALDANARVKANTEVSIGRTNSKRALGFFITQGETTIDFVLDRDQVEELGAYLDMQRHRLLKPKGRRDPDRIILSEALFCKQ